MSVTANGVGFEVALEGDDPDCCDIYDHQRDRKYEVRWPWLFEQTCLNAFAEVCVLPLLAEVVLIPVYDRKVAAMKGLYHLFKLFRVLRGDKTLKFMHQS